MAAEPSVILHHTHVSQPELTFSDLTVQQQTLEAIIHLGNDTNMYRTLRTVRIRMNRLPTLGFQLAEDPSHQNVYLLNCQEGTQANRIPCWKQDLRHAILLSVNGNHIHSLSQLTALISGCRKAHETTMEFTFAKIEPHILLDPDMPQMHYD